MRHALSAAGRKMLRSGCRDRFAVVLDYDGTLAPIVADPGRAVMRPRTRELLDRLTAKVPVAVLTGRAHADVMRFLDGCPLALVRGDYGLDDGSTAAQEPARWAARLNKRFAAVSGVVVERKPFSVCVHYRRARDQARLREELLRCAGELRARPVWGIDAISFLPHGAGKRRGLQRIAEELGRKTVYVGDDASDEEAFPDAGVSVRVGWTSSSIAPLYLNRQSEIDGLLAALGKV
jgi:trehalose 6-phosphate phosphatase